MPLVKHPVCPPRYPSSTGREGEQRAKIRKRYEDSFATMAQMAQSALQAPTNADADENADANAADNTAGEDEAEFQPVNMSYRFIMRSEGTLPVQKIVAVQKLIQNDNRRINDLLRAFVIGEPTLDFNNLIYCAMCALFEESVLVSSPAY